MATVSLRYSNFPESFREKYSFNKGELDRNGNKKIQIISDKNGKLHKKTCWVAFRAMVENKLGFGKFCVKKARTESEETYMRDYKELANGFADNLLNGPCSDQRNSSIVQSVSRQQLNGGSSNKYIGFQVVDPFRTVQSSLFESVDAGNYQGSGWSGAHF